MRKTLFLLLFCVSAVVCAQSEEELWIKNGNRNIFGVLSRPVQQEGVKYPVAIISHGFNGTYWFGKDYFEMMKEKGYMCYTFDFPCGSVNSRSDNNTMNMSVKGEVSDVQAIIDYFKSQPDVDATRIVLIGESQGGLVSALTAASRPKDVSQLVLIYPALCIPDNWNERYPKVEEIPDTTRLWNVPLGRSFFLEIRDLDVYKEIKRYKGQVLIIHGDKDQVVPLSYSERAVKKYKKAKLEVIPNARHGFNPTERALAIGWIKNFIK